MEKRNYLIKKMKQSKVIRSKMYLKKERIRKMMVEKENKYAVLLHSQEKNNGGGRVSV